MQLVKFVVGVVIGLILGVLAGVLVGTGLAYRWAATMSSAP